MFYITYKFEKCNKNVILYTGVRNHPNKKIHLRVKYVEVVKLNSFTQTARE